MRSAMAALLLLSACATVPDVVPPRAAVAADGAVVLPDCPNWSRSSREDFTNRPYSNFGCADAVNLGLMVADPADLAHGRGTGMQAGEAAARGVERYRNDTVTPLFAGNGPPAPPTAPPPAPPEPKP